MESPHFFDEFMPVDHSPVKIHYWNGEERVYGAGAINKYSWAGATYDSINNMNR